MGWLTSGVIVLLRADFATLRCFAVVVESFEKSASHCPRCQQHADLGRCARRDFIDRNIRCFVILGYSIYPMAIGLYGHGHRFFRFCGWDNHERHQERPGCSRLRYVGDGACWRVGSDRFPLFLSTYLLSLDPVLFQHSLTCSFFGRSLGPLKLGA